MTCGAIGESWQITASLLMPPAFSRIVIPANASPTIHAPTEAGTPSIL